MPTARFTQIDAIQFDITVGEAKALAHILYHYEGGTLCIVPGTGGALLKQIGAALRVAGVPDTEINAFADGNHNERHYPIRNLDPCCEP